jgi:hypothetical protein
VPTTKRKEKHHAAIKTAVNLVDMEREVNKSETHRRHRVEVQIHNTTRASHAIDTNKDMTRKPWMELFTGAQTLQKSRRRESKFPNGWRGLFSSVTSSSGKDSTFFLLNSARW